MSAAARRAAGSIVPAERTQVVVPDPGSAIDLTLWSPVPLSAQDALPLVRPAMTGARVGPTDVPHPQQAEGSSGPPTFSVTATFEYDGAITVKTGRSSEVPVALSRLDWREFGPWSYHVSWQPPEPAELRNEHPSQLHLIARSRVRAVDRPRRGRAVAGRRRDGRGQRRVRRDARRAAGPGDGATLGQRYGSAPDGTRSTDTVRREPEPSVKMTPRSGGTSS